MTELEILLGYKGNALLYTKQLSRCQQALNNSEEPVIKALWGLLRKYQKGWAQEYDLMADHELLLMEFGPFGSLLISK